MLTSLRHKRRWVRIANGFGYACFLLTAVLIILELVFVNYWLDFYGSELKGLNTEEEMTSRKPKILVFGDSFAAHPNSFVRVLKDSIATHDVINCAVPGSGIRQHRLFFESRIDQFDPEIIIYQFYVGNDLLDIDHPVNWGSLSLTRNLYWSLSDQLLVLQYINYRMGSVSAGKVTSLKDPEFSPSTYNQRVKTYLRADPALYTNMTTLHGEWAAVLADWSNHFSDLLNASSNRQVYLMIIPHCAQVHEHYRQMYRALGATQTASLTTSSPMEEAILELHNDIPCLLASDTLMTLENRGTRTYYQNDPHLNPIGQQAVGHFLLRRIHP